MGIAQDGYDNVAVQIDGSNNSVTITRGEARLTLLQRHKRRREPKKDLDLLDPYARAVGLVGRGDDLAALEDWLDGDGPIAVRCLVGRAGSGKTRLALELCERAEERGWLAGFVPHEELVGFRQRQHLAGWRWAKPTLVVVDYAAASGRVLRSWLEQLSEHEASGDRKLRLLLLERHASPEAGWWSELTRFGGFGSAGLEDLLDPREPVVLPSLRTAGERRHVLAAVMEAASRLDRARPALRPPATGTDPRFEAQPGDDLLNNEPLYLMMAGLTAVQTRTPNVLALGRLDLARRLAQAEIERIGRLADERGIGGGFLQHLAACVTFTDDVAREEIEAFVVEEQQALRAPGIDPGATAQALADALTRVELDVVDAIRPDLIGEAAIMAAFDRTGRGAKQQAGAVERAWRRAPAKTAATVIRTAQDHGEGRLEHPSLAWLDHLATLARDPAELMAIAAELPTATVSLRERAASIQAQIVDALRHRRGSDETGLLLLAGALNDLAYRLSELGRREPALEAAEEAVAIRRELAAARPDAFRPDLAVSLAVLANCLEDNGRPAETLVANREAIKTLAEPFLRLPEAFVHWVLPMVQQYLGRCEAQGSEPDGELLEPLLPVLVAMTQGAADEHDKGEEP